MDGKQNKSDKDKYCIISLICEIYNKLVNITKKKKPLRYRKQTSDYQWREGSREGQDRSRGLRAVKLLPTK